MLFGRVNDRAQRGGSLEIMRADTQVQTHTNADMWQVNCVKHGIYKQKAGPLPWDWINTQTDSRLPAFLNSWLYLTLKVDTRYKRQERKDSTKKSSILLPFWQTDQPACHPLGIFRLNKAVSRSLQRSALVLLAVIKYKPRPRLKDCETSLHGLTLYSQQHGMVQ